MIGEYIRQLGIIIDPNGRRVILPIGYLSREEAERDLVPAITIIGDSQGYCLDFSPELLPESCYSTLVFKKLSGLMFEMALRKAARMMENAIKEIGIAELFPVPQIGKRCSPEACSAAREDSDGYYKAVLKSLFLFEAMISYSLLRQEEINLFLDEMLSLHPLGFSSLTRLKIPEWVGPRRNLGVKTIFDPDFSVLIPARRTSFSEAFEEGYPCAVAAISKESGDVTVKLSCYFERELIDEREANSIGIARKIGQRFVRENVV